MSKTLTWIGKNLSLGGLVRHLGGGLGICRQVHDRMHRGCGQPDGKGPYDQEDSQGAVLGSRTRGRRRVDEIRGSGW